MYYEINLMVNGTKNERKAQKIISTYAALKRESYKERTEGNTEFGFWMTGRKLKKCMNKLAKVSDYMEVFNGEVEADLNQA